MKRNAHNLGDAVLSQIDVWWFRFLLRLEGMTDDELWWEPAPDCFTLTRGDDGAYRYEWPPGSEQGLKAPVRLTTIAWRLSHMGCAGLAGWALTMEGASDPATESYGLPFPERATEAIAFVQHWYDRWRAAVGGMSDEDLWRPLGETAFTVDAPMMFLGKEHPFVNHVLHQQRELIHHGAEVALLRDLYVARAGRP